LKPNKVILWVQCLFSQELASSFGDWSVMGHMGIITKRTTLMIMDSDTSTTIPMNMSMTIVSEKKQPLIKRLAAIAVPFGMAASPDLTILPVALAASAVGMGAVVSVLSVFAVFTIATFIGLTVIATLAGYQIKGDWLEKNANTITSLVLIAIGIVAYFGA